MSLRNLFPYWLKLSVRLTRRKVTDISNGHLFKIARVRHTNAVLPTRISLTQEIKQIVGVDAKIHNLKIAAASIQAIEIRPNEIFSFWEAVGNPSEKRGYKGGRTIVNGQVSESIGGGLCQLSGMIHLLSLEAGMTVLERHNHSLDLYTDETRFAPLGSDATVVYGYRDLRILNNLKSPIRFSFQIYQDQIEASLESQNSVQRRKVTFEVNDKDDRLEVHTLVDGSKAIVSIYLKKKNSF